MKKNQFLKFAAFSVAIFLSAFAQAQKTTDEGQTVRGINFINAGIGIGTFGFTGTGGLPITASFEHGFTDEISAGVSIGLVSTKYASYWKYNYTVIGVRGSYHFNELINLSNPKVDVYGGATLFYRRYSVKYSGPNTFDDKSSAGAVSFAIHAGGRYFFSNNFGAFAELGYGISPLQLGLTFKF